MTFLENFTPKNNFLDETKKILFNCTPDDLKVSSKAKNVLRKKYILFIFLLFYLLITQHKGVSYLSETNCYLFAVKLVYKTNGLRRPFIN